MEWKSKVIDTVDENSLSNKTSSEVQKNAIQQNNSLNAFNNIENQFVFTQ